MNGEELVLRAARVANLPVHVAGHLADCAGLGCGATCVCHALEGC